MDLSGQWRAHLGDERLRREFWRFELDDRDWPELTVPGHWRSAPAFADADGPLLYRHAFETPGEVEGVETGGSSGSSGASDGNRRSWLVRGAALISLYGVVLAIQLALGLAGQVQLTRWMAVIGAPRSRAMK